MPWATVGIRHLEHCGLLTHVKKEVLNHLGTQLASKASLQFNIRMSPHLLEKRPNHKVLIAPLRLLPHAHVAGLVHLLFVVCLCIQAIKRYSRQCFV